MLAILAENPQSPRALFRAEHQRETCFFIGDSSFRWRLGVMAAAPQPLITMKLESNDDEMLPPGRVAMTDTGRDVLTGRMEWLAICQFDRWLGGVHLRSGSMWRWKEDSGHVEKA